MLFSIAKLNETLNSPEISFTLKADCRFKTMVTVSKTFYLSPLSSEDKIRTYKQTYNIH